MMNAVAQTSTDTLVLAGRPLDELIRLGQRTQTMIKAEYASRVMALAPGLTSFNWTTCLKDGRIDLDTANAIGKDGKLVDLTWLERPGDEEVLAYFLTDCDENADPSAVVTEYTGIRPANFGNCFALIRGLAITLAEEGHPSGSIDL